MWYLLLSSVLRVCILSTRKQVGMLHKLHILVSCLIVSVCLFRSAAFLMLYGIALATEGWGVVASLKIYPPFAGAAVSAITLVVAFGFAVSRPCLTLEV